MTDGPPDQDEWSAEDLDEAIEAAGHALSEAPGGEALDVGGQLGLLLYARFLMRSGRIPAQPGGGAENDLESAIALLTQAASAPGDVDPDIAAGLGRALADRFGLSGDESDRSEAITWLRLLSDTTDQADCDPGDYLTLAVLLAEQAEEQRDCAGVTAAIGYVQCAAGGLHGDMRAFAEYLLGVGYLVRADIGQTLDDLPAAIGHLREAASLVPDGDPDRLVVEARLGLALARQATGNPDAPRADELDDAVRMLSRAREGLPADDPVRPQVHYSLATALALRFTCYAGSESDAQAALSELAALLEQPGLDTAMADVCHLLMAFVLIYRSAPETLRQRSASIDPGQAGRMLARGSGRPSPDSARSALEHLDQISDLAATETHYAHLVPSLRGIVSLSLDDGELTESNVGPWVEAVEEALRLTPADGDPETGVLHGMAGLLRAAKAARDPGEHDFGPAVDSLATAVRQLGDEHPMLPVLKSILGGAFGFALGARQPTAEESTAAITLLESVLDEVPDDHPDRASVLIRLGGLLVSRALHPDSSMPRLQKLRSQLDAAIARPAASQLNEAVNHALLGMVEGVEGMLAPDADLVRAAVERLRRAAGLAPPNPAFGQLVQACLMCLLSHLYFQEGELQYLDAANHYGREIVQTAGGDDASNFLLHTAQTLLAAGPAVRNPDQVDDARLRDMAAQLEAARERMPEGHPLRQTLASDLNLLRIARGGMARFDPEAGVGALDPKLIDEAAEAAVALAETTAKDDPFYAMNLGTAGNARAMQGILSRDRRVASGGIAMLAQACAASVIPDHRRRLLFMLAMVLRMRYDFTRDRNDLSGMISQLEEARRLAHEEGGSLLADILFMCALGYYERGDRNLQDRRRAVVLGRDALRERSATVLLQSTTDRAFDAAMNAAGEAASVVRWCLADGDAEAAVEALERGRGMVLHAATADASAASVLREAGHGGLALEWEQALAAAETADSDPWDLLPGPAASPQQPAEAAGTAFAPEFRVPSDLRHRVLKALAGTGLDRLLAPPSVTEIAQALRTAGARALVYLLPQEGTAAGLALAIDDAGGVREIRLPRLALAPRGPVAAFAQAQQDLRGGTAGAADEVRSRWQRALSGLCDWAWTAAMEQVLGSVTDGPGCPARLVLVPVGELGLVPWHAARRVVADGRLRYACQDAVLSYAASARQFTDACRNGHRRWDSEAAVVRVPESGLYFASKEVQEIHRRYYAAGILLGADDDPARPASPGNVRDLLPRPRAGGASLLHLGCHAEPASRPVDGRLLLEGGETLSMRDILRQARDRPRDAPGCLVVLAACGSDLTDGHHDEALTLATSFLAAGAAGTIGARWPVDDLPTLAFMTMFHHYLNSGYDDPSIALRSAQAWMLNPGRTFPEAFRPKIAEMVRTVDLAKTECWAAFTYQGQ